MNPELIEKVTKLVVEKLQSQSAPPASPETGNSPSGSGSVKFWSHKESEKSAVTFTSAAPENESADSMGQVKFTKHNGNQKLINLSDIKETVSLKDDSKPAKREEGLDNPFDREELEVLKSKTPARIGVGRAGLRPKTSTWLKFRYDHAAAVDAVYGDVDESLLERLSLFKVHTKVTEKEVYIRRPDYGRKLSEEAKQTIVQKCQKAPTVQIIVSDGLSSKAIEENLEDVYLSLQQSLKSAGLDTGTPFYIEKGRVAVMDDVGELLRPKVVVLLIGERPGLVSAESLSAYLCYEPRLGTIEADRMVISNIHKGGIPPVEAGAYLGTVIQKVLKYEASGVNLVQKEK